MAEPERPSPQVVIRKRYPILRWLAGMVGLVAGQELGAWAGFKGAMARGLKGEESFAFTDVTYAIMRSHDAAQTAMVCAAIAGVVATMLAEGKTSGWRPFLIGSLVAVVTAVVAGAIVGYRG